MSTLVLLSIEALPGKADAVLDKLAEILVDTRAFDGCQSVEVHRDQDDGQRFVLVESWSSRATSDAYSAWRAGRVEADGFRALLASAAKTHYDAVDV